ncbi:hypothetical protein BDP27DRAFT_665040 [Rhodocollybia butyracea]|uniref:Uncharacterized protein n=1 Tax=Rhodocollybia butyracea TaxID=206335 RepID=A0A9P5PV63_9AGAR|nr:hypothetical protein BDP27DRAFT_665040 [Rhodocollybia butyracea]
MSTHAVSVFKAFRVLVLALCSVLSIGCTTILSIFLSREWDNFDHVSRIIVVALTSVHGLGAVMLYLMIVTRLNVRLDALRVSIYLSVVIGGAVLLTIGRARLPCTNSGIGHICGPATLSVMIASFVISGCLIFYSFGLSIIACTIPGALLAKAPSDILEGETTSVNSQTRLIPSAQRAESQAFLKDRHDNSLPKDDRPALAHARSHIPQPLNLEGTERRPVFSYTVTTPKSVSSSISQSQESTYTSIRHPYAMYTESPTSSAWSYSQPSTPLSAQSNSTSGSRSTGYPISPSPVPSMRRAARRDQSPLARSESALSYQHGGIPNPFAGPTPVPSTPGTISGSQNGSPNLSLSFGNQGFPLPPSYGVSGWSSYTDEYLRSVTPPPSTPRSLIPGVPIAKRSLPSVVSPRKSVSFGSAAANLHSMGLPSPPPIAARLPPHPDLQAHLVSAPSQGSEIVIPSTPGRLTPTSAKTFRSQLLPADIPHWELGDHADE